MKFSKYNIIHTTENQEHILFNSLWGSTFVISPSVKQAIESSNPTLLTEEENRLFIKYNALIPDEYNESCIYNHFYNKSRYGKKCLTATVLLTWSCNFRCIYCYEGAGELRCENMTKNRAGAIANFLIKCSEEQRGELIHVVLFGGEPLLNIDVGFHMLGILKEYCLTSHKELQCSLVTNGSLLTEEIVSGLLNYNCKFVQITLDGPEYIHNCRRVAKDGSGTFQKVLHGITIMEEFCSQIHTYIRINVDKNNVDSIPMLLDTLKDLGISHSQVDFGITRDSTSACSSYKSNCLPEEYLPDILNELWKYSEANMFSKYPQPMRKWTYCGLFDEYSFTFSPLGELYKCWEMVGDNKHKMGYIKDDGTLTDVTFAYYDWLSIDPLKEPDCSDFKYLPICGGGCRMLSYRQTGTYHAAGCEKVKGVIEKQIEVYVRRQVQFQNN